MRILTPEIIKSALCSNCDEIFAKHGDNKCLYQPTEFKAYICPVCDWYIFKSTDLHTNVGRSSLGKKVIFHTECIRESYKEKAARSEYGSHDSIMTWLIDVRYKKE